MKQVMATIISNLKVIPDTYLMWLEAPEIGTSTRPGQFVMVRCGKDTLLRRPLSVHQVDKDKLALLFAVVGKGTNWLSQRRAGDTVDIFGPLGNGFTIHPDSKYLLLLAGGIGIAPLRLLVDVAVRQGIKVTLLMGARSATHLLPLPAGLLNEGGMPSNINVVNATDDGSKGFKGLATDLIAAYIGEADQIFACGPVDMYRTMVTLSQQFPKLKSAQLSLEIMMGCGMSVCYACTIRTKNGLKQVCQDGPVFELSELEGINWDELIL